MKATTPVITEINSRECHDYKIKKYLMDNKRKYKAVCVHGCGFTSAFDLVLNKYDKYVTYSESVSLSTHNFVIML